MKNFSFGKHEKVCLKKDIDLLFSDGFIKKRGSILIRWIRRSKLENERAVKILIVVPKKNIKLAVNRNRIKRQLREIYRLNKSELHKGHLKPKLTLLVAIQFVGHLPASYRTMQMDFRDVCNSVIAELKRDFYYPQT